MSRGDHVPSWSKWLLIIGVLALSASAVLNLFDGAYLFAFTQLCLVALLGLMLVRAEERGGILAVLLWVFLAGTALASLASLALWGQEFFNR